MALAPPNNKKLLNQSNDYTAYTGVEESSVKEQLFKYLSNIHLFVFFVVISYSLAALYLRYTDPVYEATARLFIKTGSNSIPLTTNISDAFSKALSNASPINLDNEIQLIRSQALVRRAVVKDSLHIQYFSLGRVRRINLFPNPGFKVHFLSVRDSAKTYRFVVNNLNESGGAIRFETNVSTTRFVWGKPINMGGAIIQLAPTVPLERFINNEKEAEGINVVWQNPITTANEILAALSVSPLDKKTTILLFSIKVDQVSRGEMILNNILNEYGGLSIESKDAATKKTLSFIEERLVGVTQELKEIEYKLNNFKIKNELYNVKGQQNAALGQMEERKRREEDLLFEKQLIDILYEYIKDGNNRFKTIPANFGLSEVSLNFFIGNYNTLQAKREKDLLYLGKESDLLKETEYQLQELRNNILASLENMKKLNTLNLDQAKKIEDKRRDFLSGATKEERELIEIERELAQKEKLYLYLLQKKEEMAVATSSTVSDYQQINPASGSKTPIEPDTKRIKTMAILIGLLIPFGLIYLQDLLNDKITTKNDLVKKTPIPVLGEISHINILKTGFVGSDNRSVVSEQFRILRSNLQYILKGNPDNKVILITSSISGEGKSFVSFNLAAVLSLANKKVALLEFDLRKIRNFRVPGEPPMNKGLSNYLIGQVDDHHQIGFSPENYPNLTIFPSGPLPPNPSELILDTRVEQFIASLKDEYDYIILDSAPVGIIGDSLNLANHAQAVVYIIRQRYTLKKQIEFINDLWQQKKLGSQMSIVVNDVQVQGRYGYYGYTGYGYGYGYNYKYGNYGGKYGGDPYFDQQKKNWWLWKKKQA